VTADFFHVLGVKPLLGRTLLPDVDRPGGERVAVISHALWQRRFGADQNMVGKSIRLDDESFTVVGVMPPEFQYPDTDSELWAASRDIVPATYLPENPDPTTIRSLHYLNVIARLKPGVTREQAQAEMETISSRLEAQYPNENTGHTSRVVALHEQVVGDVRSALLVLLGAVGFVLLIACANVANLLLARATARQKEMSIRTALGAGRLRLIRQMLTESTLLSLAGGAVGLMLALWGVDLLVALSPENLPRLKEIGLDGRVVGFTLAVSVLTGMIFGLAPALQASKQDLTSALKESARGSMGGFGRRRTRNLLVIAEVALALVLLIGAGLMVRSFWRLQRVDPGFNPQNLLTMELSLPSSKYAKEEQMADFYKRVMGRIETLPGVESVGATWMLPLSGQDAGSGMDIEGRPHAAPGEGLRSTFSSVSARYFRTMGIPLVRGRDFTDQDTATTPGVVIINETFARRYFPGEDPLGKRMKRGGENRPWLTIVGIVGDVRHLSLADEPRTEFYLSSLQTPYPFMNVVVRTASDPVNLMTAIRQEVWAVDRDQPVANVETMRQRVADALAGARFNTLLLGLFAAVAMILSAVGIYGIMAYSVIQRTHEIGIRMALGAGQRDILRMVVGQGMRLALVGVALGLFASFALTRVMASLLYGVTATDPLTFAGVALALLIVALLACYLPARRATKVDPMVALRYE
jgi:putative ABC transport system permease protein